MRVKQRERERETKMAKKRTAKIKTPKFCCNATCVSYIITLKSFF